MYLRLVGAIESQLRDAYARRHDEGVTQSSLARKVGVGRAAINRRLTGRANLTIKTIADLVWALDHSIKVEIFDPQTQRSESNSLRSLTNDQARLPTPSTDATAFLERTR